MATPRRSAAISDAGAQSKAMQLQTPCYGDRAACRLSSTVGPSAGRRLPPGRAARRHHRSGAFQQREGGVYACFHGILRVAAYGHRPVAAAQKEGGAAAARSLATMVAHRAEDILQITILSGVGRVTPLAAAGLAEGGERVKQ